MLLRGSLRKLGVLADDVVDKSTGGLHLCELKRLAVGDYMTVAVLAFAEHCPQLVHSLHVFVVSIADGSHIGAAIPH